MSHPHFVIDNNVFAALPREILTSEFFQKRCIVPKEVFFESHGSTGLNDKDLPVRDVGLMEGRMLKRIMNSLSVGDHRLVDLFRDQGGADPIVVAMALAHKERTSETLFPEQCIVVSEDKAVRRTAENHNLDTMTKEQFLSAYHEHANRNRNT